MTPQPRLDPAALQARADAASRLLNDPLLKESFAKLLIEYFERWVNTEPGDTAGRELLWHAARTIQHVEQHLELAVAQRPIDNKHIESMKQVQKLRTVELRRSVARAGTSTANAADLKAL